MFLELSYTFLVGLTGQEGGEGWYSLTVRAERDSQDLWGLTEGWDLMTQVLGWTLE